MVKNMKRKMCTCLQIHNDYLVPGGETKSAKLIADLLEKKGIRVIRYYKDNNDIKSGLTNLVIAGMKSFYNFDTIREIEEIISNNHIDFALIHNTSPIISNSIYEVLKKRNIKIIKYIQNYNLLCLNGALDCGADCNICMHNRFIGVKKACYKGSKLFTLQKLLCLKMLEKRYLKNIDAFVAISDFVKKRHVNAGIVEEKIYVIYHFCEMLDLQKVEQNEYFLYMGRLLKEKGVLTLIKAVASNPELQLLIMGKGPMSCEVTENRLYLKVVNHRLEMEVRKGDIVQAGVMISNSEVGLGAVSIQPLVYVGGGENKMLLFQLDEPEMIKTEEITLPPQEPEQDGTEEEKEEIVIKKKMMVFPAAWADSFGRPITSLACVNMLEQEHYAGNWDILRPAKEVEDYNLVSSEELKALMQEAERIMEGWENTNE